MGQLYIQKASVDSLLSEMKNTTPIIQHLTQKFSDNDNVSISLHQSPQYQELNSSSRSTFDAIVNEMSNS